MGMPVEFRNTANMGLVAAVFPDDSGMGLLYVASDARISQSQTAGLGSNASWHTAVVGITPNQPGRVAQTALHSGDAGDDTGQHKANEYRGDAE